MALETCAHSGRLPEEEEPPPRTMTHTMRERLSEKNGPRKTVFGVLSNKKYEVGGGVLSGSMRMSVQCKHCAYIVELLENLIDRARGVETVFESREDFTCTRWSEKGHQAAAPCQESRV